MSNPKIKKGFILDNQGESILSFGDALAELGKCGSCGCNGELGFHSLMDISNGSENYIVINDGSLEVYDNNQTVRDWLKDSCTAREAGDAIPDSPEVDLQLQILVDGGGEFSQGELAPGETKDAVVIITNIGHRATNTAIEVKVDPMFIKKLFWVTTVGAATTSISLYGNPNYPVQNSKFTIVEFGFPPKFTAALNAGEVINPGESLAIGFTIYCGSFAGDSQTLVCTLVAGGGGDNNAANDSDSYPIEAI